MKGDQVITLKTPGGSAYDPAFAANLHWCMRNGAYGFADYDKNCAFPDTGNNKYHGRFGGG
jgi:hypothetical protein